MAGMTGCQPNGPAVNKILVLQDWINTGW